MVWKCRLCGIEPMTLEGVWIHLWTQHRGTCFEIINRYAYERHFEVEEEE